MLNVLPPLVFFGTWSKFEPYLYGSIITSSAVDEKSLIFTAVAQYYSEDGKTQQYCQLRNIIMVSHMGEDNP